MNRKRPTTLEPISAAAIVIVSLHLAAVFGVWWWWQNVGSPQRNAKAMQLAWMNPADFKSLVPASTVPRAIKVASAPKATKKAPVPVPAPGPKPSAGAPVQKAVLVAAPPQQHQMEPVPNTTGNPLFAGTAESQSKPSANRSITLRRAPEKRPGSAFFGAPVPPITSPTLMDIARLNTMRPPTVPVPGSAPAAPEEEANLDAADEAVNTAFLASWIAPPIDSVPSSQREARLNISIGKDGTVLKAQMSKFSGSHVLDQSILEAAAKVKKISATLPSNYPKDSYDLEMNFLLLP
jgi:TonB-like protein